MEEENTSRKIDNDETTKEDPVAAAIYDRLITSVCISYASKMHQAIKTGQVSYYELAAPQDRRELYPDLYENEDDVSGALEKYVVEKPAKRPRPDSADLEQYTTTSVKDEVASETKSIISTRQQALTDIWGRNPPKEPKELVECSICQRQVNTLRFAQHLDKCMGIGTTTRAAAAGANGTSTRNSLK